jgi:hypothetical protein
MTGVEGGADATGVRPAPLSNRIVSGIVGNDGRKWRIKNKCERGDRFSGRTTHVSATGHQNWRTTLPASEPINENKQSIPTNQS